MKKIFTLLFCVLLFLQMSWAQHREINSEGNYQGVIRIKFSKNITEKVDALSQRMEQNHRLKTKPKTGLVKTEIVNLDRINQQFQAVKMRRIFRPAGKFEAKHRAHGLHLWYEIEFNSKTSISQLLKAYGQLSEVAITEPVRAANLIDYSVSKIYNDEELAAPNSLSSGTNDPLFPNQWHYENTGQNDGTPGADISLLDAWTVETGNQDVIVAIEDAGIDYNHEDLKGNMWVNPGEIAGNGIDDDNNGYVDDIYGYNFADDTGQILIGDHATHVAGTVAAETNNGIGVSGIAGGSGNNDGVRLMSCNVFANNNAGFAEAFVYAADNGAVISQNSWGYTQAGAYEQAVLDAIDYFIENAGGPNAPMDGGIVIFAAGNNNSFGRYYPAYYSKVMAVAATNKNDKRAFYSNFGSWVDISAPGGELENSSTDPTAVLSTLPNNSYGVMQGTSMACPHVSGTAALIVSKYAGNITPSEVWDKLVSNTDDISAVNGFYARYMGSGRLNAYKALTDDDLPLVPSGLTASNITTNSFTLNWNSVSGANSYDLQIREQGGSWSTINTSETSYNYTGATPETTYEFRARANNDAGSSAYSAIESATTKAELTPPATPANLTASNITYNSLTISWDEVTYATSYDLQIREQGGNWSTINTSETSYNYTGAAPETTYEFRVRANNDAGSSAYSTTEIATTEAEPTPPTTPVNLAASNITHNSFTISWDEVADATSYDLQIREQGGNWSMINTSATSYNYTGATPETTYEFQVRASNNAGSSAYSTTESATTDPLPIPGTPTGLFAKNITSTSFDTNWDAMEYADDYDIQIREEGASWETFNTSESFYSYSGTNPSTIYEYRVRANNSSGSSSYSTIETVTTSDDNPTPEYCTSRGSNTMLSYIDLVELSDMSNSSGDNGGYGDYTGLTANVNPGANYTLNYSAAFKFWAITTYWKVWIDFNRDGTFANEEMVVNRSSNSSGILSAEITIPTGATLGTTRMRVSQKSLRTQSACESFSYGEVEDYSVNITNASTSQFTKSVQLAKSIGETENAEEFIIYPNPATEQLNIVIPDNIQSEARIRDLRGKTITIINLEGNYSTIDISGLPTGTYLITIENEFGTTTRKLIKQ